MKKFIFTMLAALALTLMSVTAAFASLGDGGGSGTGMPACNWSVYGLWANGRICAVFPSDGVNYPTWH